MAGNDTALVCRMCGNSDLRPVGTAAGFPFVECATCGFIFTPHLPDPNTAYEPPTGRPTGGWADTAFLEPALARLDTGKRLSILDFGAGESRVPGLLRARGHRVVAVDVLPPATPHPDRYTGAIETLNLAPARFDLVYAFQVFEHLPEPAPILTELLNLTKPGGLVQIHTDMEVAERAGDFTAWWYVLPPEHCAFYRHRTFAVFCRPTPHRLVWTDEKRVLIEIGRHEEIGLQISANAHK
jgi:SAM-dependent methyltransferase